jgi:hypothetical protein
MERSSDDFPEPTRPQMPTRSPFFTSRFIPFKAGFSLFQYPVKSFNSNRISLGEYDIWSTSPKN